MRVLLALLEALSLVLVCVGSVALVTCLIDGGITDTGVSRHDDGRFGNGKVGRQVCECRGFVRSCCSGRLIPTE